jgi:hypothetical protein
LLVQVISQTHLIREELASHTNKSKSGAWT